MKRDVEYMDNPAAVGKSLLFNFILEKTEASENLVDVYVGVDFSIVVSLQNFYYFLIHI